MDFNSSAIGAALLGLATSLCLQQCNHKAELALAERRFESDLIIHAMDEDNKAVTLNRMKLLIKAGLLSQDRASILTNLSDSVFISSTSRFYTGSNEVDFYEFHVTNGRNDLLPGEQFIGGAHILIEPTDTAHDIFELTGYTDNLGKAEIVFPNKYCEEFVRVTIEKEGYRSRVFETRLPHYMSGAFEEVVLQKE